MDGCELFGPEEYFNSPIIISPRKAVPVVMTTAFASYRAPVEVTTPLQTLSSTIKRSTMP